MSLTTVGLTLVILACRDLTSPVDALRSANRLLGESGPVVVSPSAMHGWSFYNDQNDTACTDAAVCRMVGGPAGQPLGSGSAFLSTPAASDGKALILTGYGGTRFDAITALTYSTFRQSADAGHNLAIALQVNVDYDLTDQSVGYQGRLVYEPYQSAPGTVLDTTWQSWDARAGKWWGTKASVPRGGVLVTNPCVQTTPCTWTQLLAAFPNVGIHATYGAVVLKAGSSWPGFSGNVDALAIGVNGTTTTFDFEPTRPVPAHAPDSISQARWDSLTAPANIMTDPPHMRGRWARNVMMITFEPTATQADRQAVIALIQGEVVGGNTWPMGEGEYIVRIPYAIPPDSISGPVLRAFLALRGHPAVAAAYPLSMDNFSKIHYRKPTDGAGFTSWPISRDSGTGPNWGHSISQALWDSLTAPANLMVDVPHLPSGPWVKNLMLITFNPTATQADRQAVIALIHGEVIGGNVPPAGERQYIVRIPYAAPGDSIQGPVLRAFLALKDHPAVLVAYPVGMFNPNVLHYRKPIDGTGFTAWPMSRDEGTGPNSGRVAVNAPFAWGCVTGTEAGIAHPALAVVDLGFHEGATDLRGLTGSIKDYAEPSDTAYHGTAIASIIGAAGNNHDGVTGMPSATQ